MSCKTHKTCLHLVEIRTVATTAPQTKPPIQHNRASKRVSEMEARGHKFDQANRLDTATCHMPLRSKALRGSHTIRKHADMWLSIRIYECMRICTHMHS